VADAELGSMRVQAPVPRFSDTPGEVRHLGPPLGAHTDEVYRDLLGLGAERLAELREKKII
jgi:crotonobetainyl-CoA:carnitine CoA-transferase CaiB-like acyl-CoA transferase